MSEREDRPTNLTDYYADAWAHLECDDVRGNLHDCKGYGVAHLHVGVFVSLDVEIFFHAGDILALSAHHVYAWEVS